MFWKKGVLKNFAKITRKPLCQSLFFNKDAALRPATLFKKRLWHRCFPVNFAKFLRTPFLQITSVRLLLNRIKCSWQNVLCMCLASKCRNMFIWDMGIKFLIFPVHLLRLTCFSFYIIMYKRKKVCEYLPVSLPSLT